MTPGLEALTELVSVEEFLDYFAVAYEPAVVQVNRLHILQRFRDYLEAETAAVADGADPRQIYARCLERAYRDFVASDALTERALKGLRRAVAPREIRIPLSAIPRRVRPTNL